MSFQVTIDHVKNFIGELDADMLLVLRGLGHIAPLATQAAIAAETLTGNVELIPMTQAAGAAASAIGLSANTATNSLQTVSVVSAQVHDLIGISNGGSVGNHS